MARYPFDAALPELDPVDLVPESLPRRLPPRPALPPMSRLPAPPALPRTRSSLPPAPFPRHLQAARTPLPPLPVPSHLPAKLPSFESDYAMRELTPSYDDVWEHDSSRFESAPRSDPAFSSYPPTAITLPPSAMPSAPAAAPSAPAVAPVAMRPTVDRRAVFAAAAGVALGALVFSVALGASVADAATSPAKLNASRALSPSLAAASLTSHEAASTSEEPAVVDAESLPLLGKPQARTVRRASAKRHVAKPQATRAVAGRSATLNFNSFPVSTVLVDGRPVGSTPLQGVRVPAGNHFVVFASPQHGRKVASVKAVAGKSSTLVVRFDR